MGQIFQNMNEDYIEKHYPNRSVFEAVAKTTKKVSIGVYAFFGIVLAGCLAGIGWSVNTINAYKQSGDTEMADVGMIICIVFAAFALISALAIIITVMRAKKGAEDWIKKSASNSKLTESEIREFEQQAMASDSYILKMQDAIDSVMSGAKDGILTRDFIYLADINLTVIRCKDLVSACLTDMVIYIGEQHNRRPVHYLGIQLLSKKGAHSFAEVSPEAGNALVELLLQKYPTINTCDGRILSEKEYDEYKKSELAKV